MMVHFLKALTCLLHYYWEHSYQKHEHSPSTRKKSHYLRQAFFLIFSSLTYINENYQGACFSGSYCLAILK